MILRLISFSAKAAAAGAALAAIGFAAGAGNAGATGEAETSGPVRCEIQASSAAGMTTLQGVVHADTAVTGTYSFRVTGSGGGGSSNIQQGGMFAAGPEGPAELGQVMLSGGSAYDARLEITADGTTLECSKRVGGSAI
jgi:hypothetical protein